MQTLKRQCCKSQKEDEVSQRLQVDYTEARALCTKSGINCSSKTNSVGKMEPHRAQGER